MSQASGPWPNRFVWHDLMTKDGAKAQKFYSALFNWEIAEIPMGPCTYRMIHCGPGPIGGIVEEQNIPVAHWMPYLAVNDVDAAAKQVTGLGGSVCVPPTDIPNTGRFSVVGDPQGGYLSLYKGNPDSAGADPDAMIFGRVCWNELLTKDPVGAQKFYSALCGWQPENKDMGPMGTYFIQKLGDKQAAGMMKTPDPNMPTAWLVYFGVEKLGDSTAKAKSLGATAMMENVPIPEVGAFSLLADPTGAVFALFEANMGNC
jgi:uncharacterized protein